MSRLDNKLAYEKKAAELRGMIEKEALALQDILSTKQTVQAEVDSLKAKKTDLLRIVGDIEIGITEKKKEFEDVRQKKETCLASIKEEAKKEGCILEQKRSEFAELIRKLESIRPVVGEMISFIQQEKDARTRYVRWEDELVKIEKRYGEISKRVKQTEQERAQQNKDLDSYKQYLVNLYGKLAAYTTTIREAAGQVNELMEKGGVPAEFESPPEVVKINLGNFEQYV